VVSILNRSPRNQSLQVASTSKSSSHEDFKLNHPQILLKHSPKSKQQNSELDKFFSPNKTPKVSNAIFRNQGLQVPFSWCRDDHLLSAGLDVSSSLRKADP